MSLTNVLQNRRQFLKLSALGAGGVLVLSGMLQSCSLKDHDIPNPDSPSVLLPLLGDDYGDNFSWNDDSKIAVMTGLNMIPVAGEILSALVDILWPVDKPNVWDQIKAQVEALIDQKIAADKYQTVSEDLEGLKNVLTLYMNELKNGTPSDIRSQWMETRSHFVNALPHFQSAGNEVPLLPLFGQFATLYLSLLRDGVKFGQSWGRSDGDHQQDIIDLQTAITSFVKYAAETYNNIGRVDVVSKTKRNDHLNEPFKSINTYDRQMTLTVLDFMQTWPYFDVTQYPDGTSPLLTREIYSDPYGSCDWSTNGNPINIETTTLLPSNITLWASDRVDAVQLTYTGKGAVSITPRMGVQEGGKVAGGSPSKEYTFNPSPSNPITKVRVLTAQYQNNNGILGPFPSGMQFQYNDNSTTNVLGGVKNAYNNIYDDTQLFGYPGEALSSIYIHGANKVLGGADCAVFGFMYWQSPAATLRAISTLYVKSPTERPAADFHKAFPQFGISAGSITKELEAARKAFWASVKKRADEIAG
ncbi:insecticidal delta-endotoxin Cry8Ea1 family protein [Dyadobacter alkalitolerans]|uniref:insecticidal delta-endotoxin Cry8Ea1 family protein n=1 Tax=Dyadobacter alkalitolerans TaxID=492736 RepID=UPI00041149F1|nr:insecticidal delta-endotoxin Cry8Ea1 family protein [Dyadobacter alkalitolerans]